FLIDMALGKVEQKLDWNSTDIDVSGRGGDRGLRGIAFYGDHVIVAANAEILFLDREFGWTHTYTCRYLRHCHEIAVAADLLFVTSTGFDSILTFDLRARSFTRGLQLSYQHGMAVANSFDPQSAHGPAPRQSLHLNSVTATADDIYVSGLHTQELLRIRGEEIAAVAKIPSGTHNAQWLEGSLLYNDTASDRLCYRTAERLVTMSVPQYEPGRIHNPERIEASVARPGFARGLCPVAPGYVAGGSSPSTVSIYHLASGTRTMSQSLSMDVRNAIHGVAVWPYG
ncbi:hypothetical protein, partial [Steroidobacter sp.]|uniref:hypothetical protein n=1 Tax=Steroidobacter sp. TaxID=1978227 RepID=UPI001A417247